MDSEEFFDVHTDDDSDDDTLREPLTNGHAGDVFDEVISSCSKLYLHLLVTL